jgi:chromosome segregation protein
MRRSASEASNRVAAAEREHASIEENAAAAEADRASIEARVAEVQARRAELEASITGCADEFAQQETILRAKEASLQGLRINEAQLRERAGSLKRELDAGRALINDRERRLAEVNRILSKTDLEASQFTGGEDELEKRIEALVQQLSTKREELAVIKDRLEQSNAHLNGVLERIRELRKTADDKTARATHLALETEKLNGDMAHLVQNLEEKYGPGCLDREPTTPVQEEMTDPVVTAEMSAEEEKLLGEEVERLRERIRRLGEVNPSADSEYDEVKKRYDYLATEKADLDHSIQNLQDAIEHINKTSEERFRKAFDAIKERFERLFPIIFGGGSAHLSLVYPEGSTDILEAGVDILAQPPGKKVSNITLLSGGEKALTAVSLIFAIFMVKPSPFCVLDEVDAPLDDANIGKFNALLREMSAKSQFILITHNKKTMELNDVLYGVTMEEPGVSKMVSIQMS